MKAEKSRHQNSILHSNSMCSSRQHLSAMIKYQYFIRCVLLFHFFMIDNASSVVLNENLQTTKNKLNKAICSSGTSVFVSQLHRNGVDFNKSSRSAEPISQGLYKNQLNVPIRPNKTEIVQLYKSICDR